MKRAVFLAVAILAIVGVVGSTAAYAQDVTIVNIGFKFTVGNKVMQPGKYEVRLNDDRSAISLIPERGQAIFIPAITRLALQHPITDGRLVFDVVGEQYVLSEVWLPVEDGFLVHDTRQPHKHHVLNAEKKKTH